jgi:hypothetical protein
MIGRADQWQRVLSARNLALNGNRPNHSRAIGLRFTPKTASHSLPTLPADLAEILERITPVATEHTIHRYWRRQSRGTVSVR